MSRLIVLSNRVKMPDNNPMAGGLAVALHDVLTDNPSIWMGWNGDIIDADNPCCDTGFRSYKPDVVGTALQSTHAKITYMTTALTRKQYQHFYCGFANNVLWLLLHEQPELMSQALDDYAGYQEVNLLFAQQLSKIIEPDDVIWVHDYHFLSVAYHCRKLGVRNRIGFFLHIPFAPLACWQQLTKSAELMAHLAHYDVIGTQTQQDKASCLSVFQYYLKDKFLISTARIMQNFAEPHHSASAQLTLDTGINTPHSLTINAYPIGVNVAKIQQQVSHLSIQALAHNQKQNTIKSTAQQIIAVDRIDYSKGLLERFLAYGHFLEQYPAYQRQLKLLQIACPSRLDLPVYQQLYSAVKQAVTTLNHQFSFCRCRAGVCQSYDNKPCQCNDHIYKIDELLGNWQAITYSESVLNHDTLMQAFWQSDVGWVNSLKDGMNLVAKEYIAAQNPDNPGVLLLSRYAGAAEQMQAAVMIDPHQPISIVQGLHVALNMPLTERKDRHQRLLQGLQQYDLQAWHQTFLNDLYAK